MFLPNNGNGSDQLFPVKEAPKRSGILKTYHLKLYEDPATTCNELCENCCFKKQTCCVSIVISVAFIVVGTIATLYGYFLPTFWMWLDDDKPEDITAADRKKIKEYKDLFYGIGFSVMAIGVLAFIVGILVHCFENVVKTKEKLKGLSGIMVDYELPPHDVKVEEMTFDYGTDVQIEEKEAGKSMMSNVYLVQDIRR